MQDMNEKVRSIIEGLSGNTKVIVILGPTAGGKSELAAQIAKQIDAEIIGADSMQVYKYMDAGTAKPPKQLQEKLAHHIIDIVSPTQKFTVADWLKIAEKTIDNLQANNKPAVVVGGTNLYVKALLEGLFDGPAEDKEFRKSLENIANNTLHEKLEAIDKEASERIAINDRRRAIRALEVFHLTNTPLSKLQRQWDKQRQKPYRYNPVLIGLHWQPEDINLRINKRVKAMFYPEKVEPVLAKATCPNGESLIDETARLEIQDLLGKQAREALGYKQVLEYLQGKLTLEESFEKTKIQTRRFAKQQRTWLKRFRNVHWIEGKEVSN